MENKLQKRKRLRLKGYDYSTPGMYFITVCTENRREMLGKIVVCGDSGAPKMVLSEYGKILEKYLKIMNEKYSHIKIYKYVIMPNHFHLIIYIKDYAEGNNSGLSASAKTYNSEISKFISLLKRYCNREYGDNIWQTSYNDHIIRTEKEFYQIWEYIDSNVLRWKNDYT